MLRNCCTLFLIASVGLALPGCQSTKSLFGKKELPNDLLKAENEIANGSSKQQPNTNVADFIDRADRDLAAQRYAAAKSNYEQALKADATNSHAHHRLAVIADVQKRFQDAEEHYQAALVRDGRNSQVLSDFGYSYILQSRLDDAEMRLNQARAADPSNLNAAANLALLYAHRGDREKCTAVARLLGPADATEKTVDSLFAQAAQTTGRPAPTKPAAEAEKSGIQLAGAFDFLKREKEEEKNVNGVSPLTIELAERMEAARAESLRERQRRAAYDQRRQLPSTGDILDSRGVHPNHLNDALAEIDREQSPHANQSLQSDPRVQRVQPGGGGYHQTMPQQRDTHNAAPTQAGNPWANQQAIQSTPQSARPANQSPFASTQNGQQPTHPIQHLQAQQVRSQGGVVTADLTESAQSPTGPARRDPSIVGVTGNASPQAAAWPSNLSSQGSIAADANANAQTQPFPNQPPNPFGQSNMAAPGSSPQGGNDLNAARQRAAALGMGTGLGGMFDRYAYKQSIDANGNMQNQQNGSSRPPANSNTGANQSPYPLNGSASQQPAADSQFPGNTQFSRDAQFPGNAQGDVSRAQQQWPGTDSRFGSQYPQVQRQLPTDRQATPPAISPGMPLAPNWQGQQLPTQSPNFSGPSQYGTITPSPAFAPTPPRSSFGPPVMNVEKLPTFDSARASVNQEFNNLQRQMMGAPNRTPAQGTAPQSPFNSPTRTGPTNPNVPYYGQNTGPNSGGMRTTAPAQNSPAASLPPGFVQPPPYNGGQSGHARSSNGGNHVTPQTSPQASGNGLPQITPGG